MIISQVKPGEDDLSNDHSKRVRQDVLLILVCCIWCRRHNQPEDLQVREVELLEDLTNTEDVNLPFVDVYEIFVIFCNFL